MATVSTPADRARRHVLNEHHVVVTELDACADAVAGRWAEEWATDRAAVVEPLRTCLESRGLLARLPSVLAAAVDAAGFTLPAPPVAAPPYVVVTSRGPILRATIDPGRLVIRLEAFEISHASPPRYRRCDATTVAVSLERKSRR